MRCPHCRTEVLIAVEYDQIEVDFCDACRGVWLDAGELELLFGDPTAVRAFLTIGSPADLPHREKARLCPECDAKMSKETTESEPPILFDHCPKGHGLWLDHGELETILRYRGEVLRGAPVVALLQQMFTQAE